MIKQTAFDMHFKHRREEIPIGEALDEGFDVNFGRVHKNHRGENSYSYYFLMANELFKERFGLDQEVLAIYDWRYKSDARIFGAVREIINRYNKTSPRLETGLVFLIINGEKNSIQKFIDNNKETVFVVINMNDLLEPKKEHNFLRNLLSVELGSFDLFSLSSPLETDTYLFGREDLLTNTINKIINKKENAGFFGLRKTGKTSVLFALKRRFNNLKILSIYLDCQMIHRSRWWRLLEYIAYQIYLEAKNQIQNIPDTLYKEYSAENAQIKFEGLVRLVLDHTRQIVLLFDEIEYITPKISGFSSSHWDEDFVPFWQIIRGLHQITFGKLCFTVAGVNPYISENAYITEKQNPVFQLVQPTYLEPLDQDTIKHMLTRIGKYVGMKFHEEVFDYLKNEYGGHAFLIRLACSELFKQSKAILSSNEYTFGIQSFMSIDTFVKSRLKSPCMEVVLSLIWWYPEEYELLEIVTDGDLNFVKEYIQENRENFMHIINYGLIDHETCEFNIGVLKSYIKMHGQEWKRVISPFKRSGFTEADLPTEANLDYLSSIFDRRSKLEQRLRKLIFIYLSMSVGHDHQRLSRLLCDSIKSKAISKPEDLFFGRQTKDVMNDLYFSSLYSIIERNWSLFEQLFDAQKDRFNMNMREINKYRNSEAHVKPITEKEFLDFDTSYKWIEKFVDKALNNLLVI